MSNIKKLGGKGSFFRTLIVSYITILIIPIFISVFSYYESLRIINNEVNNFMEMVLTQFQQNIDSALTEIEDITDYIIWNPEIKWIVNSVGNTEKTAAADTLNIINRLKSLSNTSSLIKRIYIISNTRNKEDISFSFIFPEDYMGKKFKWNELSFSNSEEYITDVAGTDNIIYVKKIPIISPGIESAYAAVFLDRKNIEKRLLGMEWLNQGGGIIYDNTGGIIVSSSGISDGAELNSSDFIESVRMSDVNGWKYVSVLSRNFLYRKVLYLRVVIIISVIFCAASGLFAAWLLAVKNYNPVESIIRIIRKQGNNSDIIHESSSGKNMDEVYPVPGNSNEFSFIENSINEILTINKNMSEKLEQQKDLLKKRFLSRLISGRNIQSNDTVMESLRNFGIDSDCSRYLIIIFYIEDFSTSRTVNPNFKNSSQKRINDNLFGLSGEIAWKLFQDTVENESSTALANPCFKTWFTEIDGQIVELVGYCSEDAATNHDMPLSADEYIYSNINIFAENLMSKLEASSFPVITSAVSNTHESIDSVVLAYNEALEAVEYELLMGKGNIIFYRNLPESESAVNSFTPIIDIQIRVINSIRSGDFKAARTILTGFVERMMAEKIDISIVKSRMSSVASTVLDILNIMIFQDEKIANKQSDFISSLLKCSNLPELQDFLDDFFDFLDNSIQSDRSNRKADTIVNEAVEYIISNYCDNNLSGGLVAESLDVSIQYLSMIFKKKKGTGLLDFIHKIRIEKGKIYLKKNTLTVKEIADKIGYYNDLAFIRAFKRYEGTTPGKYREFDL